MSLSKLSVSKLAVSAAQTRQSNDFIVGSSILRCMITIEREADGPNTKAGTFTSA